MKLLPAAALLCAAAGLASCGDSPAPAPEPGKGKEEAPPPADGGGSGLLGGPRARRPVAGFGQI